MVIEAHRDKLTKVSGVPDSICVFDKFLIRELYFGSDEYRYFVFRYKMDNKVNPSFQLTNYYGWSLTDGVEWHGFESAAK